MLKKFIATQFKKPSGIFGNVTSNIMVKGNQKNYERLIKDMDIQPQDKLLEIGYGPGIGVGMIAEICPGCTIHGIDFSKLMYKKAQNHNKQYISGGKVKLQYGDFLKAFVLDTNYDKIFCLNVVYFWNELNTPFKKVFTLLKKGGGFYIYMADRNMLEEKKAPDSVFNKYSIDRVIEALNSSGFQNANHFFDKGHYITARK